MNLFNLTLLGFPLIRLQYPGQVWKLPMIEEWLVVVNGRDKVEDMRKATDDQLSGVRSNPVVSSPDIFFFPLRFT